MKLRRLFLRIFGLALLGSACLPLQAQTIRAIYTPFLGTWKGELTYRDYSSDKMVTLPTTLEVTLTTDAKMLRQHYVYDDGPGKQVEETDTIVIDTAKSTYTVQSDEDKSSRVYVVTGLETFAQKGDGTLVLSGVGEDNGKKSDIRNTIIQSGNKLTILHESRLPGDAYRFRNRYTFTRAEKAAPTVTMLTAKQLEADFAIFEKAYKELHPGLYRYNTLEQMEGNFQILKKQLQHDQSLPQAYLAFSTFLAKIKCGHSYPNFYNQPSSVVREVLVRQPRIPFYFRWIGRKMIVTRNFSREARLIPGTEVLALNGTPVAKIQERLVGVSRADGSNYAKRVSNMEVRGEDKYEAFDIYFPLLFPFAGDQITLQVKLPSSGVATTLTLPLMSHEQRLTIQKQDTAAHAPSDDAPGWEFRFLPDKQTAYLRLTTWALFNSKWDWKGFLDNSFTQMADQKTINLVIDLRGNEGGMSIGNHILSKLIIRDLPLQSLQRWVRYRSVPADLVPYLDTWDFSFRDWGKDIRAADSNPKDGFFRMTRFDDGPGGDIITASAQPFLGHTYVIVDASNSSATFEFAQIIQQNRLGTLVGQPTGGNQRGINGGAFFFLNLPNSKIEVDLPLIGAFPPSVHPVLNRLTQTRLPDAGLTPDILVTPSVQDIQNGVDTELITIQKAVHGNQKTTLPG